jgi:hypothetical protein
MKSITLPIKWFKGIVTALALLQITSIVHAGEIVPNTFSSGDTVSASKMNDNFSELEFYLLGAVDYLTITVRENSDSNNSTFWGVSDVVIVTCNVDELLVGGNCTSDHDDFNSSTTNYGIIEPVRQPPVANS